MVLTFDECFKFRERENFVLFTFYFKFVIVLITQNNYWDGSTAQIREFGET